MPCSCETLATQSRLYSWEVGLSTRDQLHQHASAQTWKTHNHAYKDRRFRTDSSRCAGAHHLSKAFKPARVNPIKLAYDPRRPDGRPIATSAFNRLGMQYTSSPGHRAYCYAELAVSSLAVAKTIASTHCAYPVTAQRKQLEIKRDASILWGIHYIFAYWYNNNNNNNNTSNSNWICRCRGRNGCHPQHC